LRKKEDPKKILNKHASASSAAAGAQCAPAGRVF
jgi:hypothetical protein